jgi:hypothetical protein
LQTVNIQSTRKLFNKTKCNKMNLARIKNISIGIFPNVDYERVVHCYKNAIRHNEIEKCKRIDGMLPIDYFILLCMQVITNV